MAREGETASREEWVPPLVVRAQQQEVEVVEGVELFLRQAGAADLCAGRSDSPCPRQLQLWAQVLCDCCVKGIQCCCWVLPVEFRLL